MLGAAHLEEKRQTKMFLEVGGIDPGRMPPTSVRDDGPQNEFETLVGLGPHPHGGPWTPCRIRSCHP